MLVLRVFGFASVVLALVGVALGQQPAQTESTLAIRQAVQLARDHRYAEAEATLEGVSAPTDPTQKIAFYRLRAAIASGLGNSAAAAENMDNAAKLAPANQDLRIAAALARLQEQVENHVSPAQTLKRLRSEAVSPQQAVDIRLHLAEILSRANLFSEAAVDFAAASALAPGRGDLLYDLALANFHAGHLDDALASAERARSVADAGATESLIGDIQEKRGDPLAAVRSYQSAVTLEPSEERYHVALGLELLRHQTFDAALVVFKQASTLFPQSVRVKVLLGLAYYFVDRSDDAIQALQDAAKIDPQDETAARYLGEITLQDTSTPEPAAIAQVCTFADAHPQDGTADAFCGGILLKAARDTGDLSRRPEILRRLQHAARNAPREPMTRCQLGKALEWAELWSEAKPETEACVRLDPGSPDGHYQLARIYRRLGLAALANQQTSLQKAAALRQSEESVRRTEKVTKFLVLLDH
jgi:tetratricopeptide (TPR) repeat protein